MKLSFSFVDICVTLFLGLLLLLLYVIKRTNYGKEIREYLETRRKLIEFAKTLPGPPTLPIIGNALELWEPDEAVLTATRIGREMGGKTFRFWLGPLLKVMVVDPEDLKIVITSTKAGFKDDIYKLMEPGVVNGLINANGPSYKAHKRLIQPVLNGSQVIDKFTRLFNDKSQDLVERMKMRDNAGEYEIGEDAGLCIGDITLATLIGESVMTKTGEVNPFLKQTQTCLHTSVYRMTRPWFYPLCLFRLTPKGREYMKIINDAHAFIDGIIAEKMQNYNPEESTTTADKSLADFLVAHMMETKEWEPKEIRYEIVTLFVGIYESVEGVALFLLLMLAMHPDVQEKARNEVRNVVKSDFITESETKELEYLDMVIREVIRLFPVGPILPRKTTDEIKLTTCTLPKGCSVIILPFATHRDPKHWKDAHLFIPDRFLPENSKDRHPYAFVPFSGGPRSCVGPRYAMLLLKIVASYVLRSYELSTTLKYEDIKVRAHISTRCANGFPVSVRKLNENK